MPVIVMMIMVVIMVMIGVIEKLRFALQNMIEIEGIAAKNLRQRNLAAFRAMDRGGGVDLANARLDLRQFVRVDQVGLVQKHDVGECKLLLCFMRLVDLAQQMLCINHGDDCIQLRIQMYVVVHVEGLGHGSRVGQDL